MANAGLRTLCVAYRYLDETEYLNWSIAYEKAANSIRDRDEEIDKACEFIEHSLTILGATALEDKLQEGVPATIETLHQAGIKLWVSRCPFPFLDTSRERKLTYPSFKSDSHWRQGPNRHRDRYESLFPFIRVAF